MKEEEKEEEECQGGRNHREQKQKKEKKNEQLFSFPLLLTEAPPSPPRAEERERERESNLAAQFPYFLRALPFLFLLSRACGDDGDNLTLPLFIFQPPPHHICHRRFFNRSLSFLTPSSFVLVPVNRKKIENFKLSVLKK